MIFCSKLFEYYLPFFFQKIKNEQLFMKLLQYDTDVLNFFEGRTKKKNCSTGSY